MCECCEISRVYFISYSSIYSLHRRQSDIIKDSFSLLTRLSPLPVFHWVRVWAGDACLAQHPPDNGPGLDQEIVQPLDALLAQRLTLRVPDLHPVDDVLHHYPEARLHQELDDGNNLSTLAALVRILAPLLSLANLYISSNCAGIP